MIIPQETVDLIIDVVAANGDFHTLLTLLRAGPDFAWCRSHLYRTIDISDVAALFPAIPAINLTPRFRLFLDLVQSYPNISRYVRSLALSGWELTRRDERDHWKHLVDIHEDLDPDNLCPILGRLITSLPNLHTLRLDFHKPIPAWDGRRQVSLEGHLPHLDALASSRVKHLICVGVEVSSTAHVASLGLPFPHLDTAQINHTWLSRRGSRVLDMIARYPYVLQRRIFPHADLRRLYLLPACQTQNPDPFVDLASFLPSRLQLLYMDQCHIPRYDSSFEVPLQAEVLRVPTFVASITQSKPSNVLPWLSAVLGLYNATSALRELGLVLSLESSINRAQWNAFDSALAQSGVEMLYVVLTNTPRDFDDRWLGLKASASCNRRAGELKINESHAAVKGLEGMFGETKRAGRCRVDVRAELREDPHVPVSRYR